MGLVAHPVFKTGRAEQPSAWKVRFLRRSVPLNTTNRDRHLGFERSSRFNGT